MHLAIGLVSMLAVVIAVTALCRRYDLAAPVVLVAVGIAASYLWFVPKVQLTEEIVLIGLLPPLLYSAALQTSLVDFNANRRPILLLSIGLVAFTTVAVGLLVHAVLPGVSWPAAFAIGAVVAPPDAVAATAVARRIGLPRRLVTILEGESLLNDATALVALSTAIAAVDEVVTVQGVALDFLVAAGGGVVVGIVTFKVIAWLRRKVTDPVIDTSLSIVTPFAAYVAAEEVHASGVLAIVIAGLLLGHKAPVLQTPSSRISERLNWRTFSFLLENSVFLLIGLQARWIISDVVESDTGTAGAVGIALLVLVAVIALRLVWVFPARYLLIRPGPDPSTGQRPSLAYTAVLGWAGMRGVVTLAAAFAIPEDFPQREVLVLIALVVTAGTLGIQGLSLPWLVRRLRVPSPDPREDALARASLLQQASQAGLARLETYADEDDPHEVQTILRARVEQREFAAWERLGEGEPEAETPSEAYARLRKDMLQAERARVLEVRSRGTAPHEVVADVLAALDVEESMLEVGLERRAELREARGDVSGARVQPGSCEHLDAATDAFPDPPERVCEDCVREGTTWVHLRRCLTCGQVGCCDSSPRRHASAHHHETEHPVMRSVEPGEEWRWCFVDELVG